MGGTDLDAWFGSMFLEVKEPAEPEKPGFALVGWYKEEALQNKWNFANDTLQGNMTLYAAWTEGIKFTFSGAKVSTLTLGEAWNPKDMGSCKWSPDGINYTSITNKMLAFPALNSIFFKGDCTDSAGTLAHMFSGTFASYKDAVRLTGSVIGIMGGGSVGSLQPVNNMFLGTFASDKLVQIPFGLFYGINGAPAANMFASTFADNQLAAVPDALFVSITGAPAENAFSSTFEHNKLATLPADMFTNIEGEPAVGMFKNTFADNQLTALPDGLLRGIVGAPIDEMFYGTFADNHTLSEVGDLGMNILRSTDSTSAYQNMFQNAGDSASQITLPAGGAITLFTSNPATSVNDLARLYFVSTTNAAFSGAGWSRCADYANIAPNWK
jgi:uncharacterized repeat protein (TIGR02543 family)